MTNDRDLHPEASAGHNNPDVPHLEPFDPVIAERFGLLDRVDPPDPVVGLRPSKTTTLPTVDSDRSRFLLAVAAAVALLVMAAGAFIASSGGDESIDVAGDMASESGDELSTRSTTNATLSVEPRVSDRETTTSAPPADSDKPSPSDSVVNPTQVDQTASSTVPETGKTTETGPTTVPETTVPKTTVQETTVPETTDPETTDPKSTLPPEAELVTIRGVVTEVMLDCQVHVILNEDGTTNTTGPVICDGGNFIVVDGIRISTSSGYVPVEMAFNNHPEWLRPGLQVTVIAVQDPGGWVHVNCEACSITRG
jgi:hypothetical protein